MANKIPINLKRKRSPSENIEKFKRPRYKSILICSICDGDAHGYNFDAISCESCKAFFRRNAMRSISYYKCRGTGHCDVSFNVKKRCKKCRLAKCFQQGMRKEWILSDKEKQEKRSKIEDNRRLKRLKELKQQKINFNFDQSSIEFEFYLTDEHWSHLQSIQINYTEAVRLNRITGIFSYPLIQTIDSTLDLFRIPLYISSMRLITFFKQTKEFQQLDRSTQLYLIKLNLITICFYHSLHIYDSQTDSYHEHDTDDPVFLGSDWTNTLSKQFHFQMNLIRMKIIDELQSDQYIMKLVMFIILFSRSVCRFQFNQDTCIHNNQAGIFKGQNVYTELMYRYCLQQYDLSKAPVIFMKYIFNIMKIQQLVDELKYNIQEYINIAELSPLIQSLIM